YSTGDALPSIEKTASVKDAKVGDEITYTIKLSNDKKASSAWKSVVLTDKIPSGMTFIEGSVYVNNVAATHTVKNGTLTVNLGDIAAGKTVTVTFKAKINGDMYNQTIYNTAVAKGTNGYVTATGGKKTNIYEDKDDGVYVKKGDTAPYVIKTADKSSANVGDKITYTVKVGNSDGAVYEIENAKMADTIPAEFDFVDGSVQVDGKSYPYSYDNASRKLSVFIGNLKPNAARTVTFTVTVNKSAYGKIVHNTAVLSGDNIKDTEGKDKGVEIGDGKAKPQIDKSANKSSARVGDKIAYTLTVKNDDTATVPVENGVITDVLPVGLTFEYGSVTLNGKNTNDYTYDENTRLLTVNVGTIEPDAKQIIGFTATVNEAAYNTTIQNLATLTSDNADPVQDKDDGVAIADGDALLTVSKSADKTTAKVGDTITYTVNATNATGADVNICDAVMTDTIPNGLTFRGNVTVDGYSAEYQYDNTGKTLTVSLGEIAPNQTKAIRFDVTVNSDAYGMHIENTALVSGSNTPDKSGTDNGVDIEDGEADGHAGNKTANKTTTAVGDTIT
ncbi:MAG: isopeptide-forming domain-containing fimbrial protein, partial [Butyricicoccus sp.]